MIKNKFILILLCMIAFNASAGQLERITSIKNNAIESNQIGFSTANIPSGSAVTVYCNLNNQADFSGYLFVTPYSGSFSGISHQTCTTSSCGTITGPKIYLGLANTTVTISGVKQSNQAVILTNYSSQNLYVTCGF